MKKINKFLLIAFAISVVLFGCKKDVLNVPNENDPDFDKVLATPQDVETLAGGLFNTVFNGEQSVSGVKPMLAVAADNATCSWGNFGMRDLSWEPRNNAWNNSPTYSNGTYTKYSYDRWYSAIGSASDILTAIKNGMVILVNGQDRTKRTIAMAKFALGLAYGNLALVYDKVHVVDESKKVEPTIASAVPYKDVAVAALAYLDEALALTENSFTIPKSWLGTASDLTGTDFKKIINTSAARILAYLPRNKTELAAVNWARVKTYADAGITNDWMILQDNNIWVFWGDYYLTIRGWARTDMYVANLMEPSLPQHWTDIASFPHPAKPVNPLDKRLESDFEYLPSNDFLAARGYYHFSCYRFKRYDNVILIGVGGIGPKPTILAEENNLLRAEARAYTGDLAGAAAIINAGTRVTRGNLAPVAEVLQDIVNAIHHERYVELYCTGGMIQFYEMRKLDKLQKGTPLHMPIPGAILGLFGEKTFYTFGTTAKADGIGTSNGGWR